MSLLFSLGHDPLTANEAAWVTGVPLKEVHRILDSGMLGATVQTRARARMLSRAALVGLRLAYLTADTLTPQARRRIIGQALAEPTAEAVVDQSVSVALGPSAEVVRQGLCELDRAREMVSVDPEVMGGAPCLKGSRIPIHDLADMAANGDSPSALAEAYPALTHDQIEAAVAYARSYPRRGRPPARAVRRRSPPDRVRTLDLADLPNGS